MLSAGLTAYSVHLAVRCWVSAVVTRHPNLARAARHRIRRPHADANDAIDVVTTGQISRQPGPPPGPRGLEALACRGRVRPNVFYLPDGRASSRGVSIRSVPTRRADTVLSRVFFFLFFHPLPLATGFVHRRKLGRYNKSKPSRYGTPARLFWPPGLAQPHRLRRGASAACCPCRPMTTRRTTRTYTGILRLIACARGARRLAGQGR